LVELIDIAPLLSCLLASRVFFKNHPRSAGSRVGHSRHKASPLLSFPLSFLFPLSVRCARWALILGWFVFCLRPNFPLNFLAFCRSPPVTFPACSSTGPFPFFPPHWRKFFCASFTPFRGHNAINFNGRLPSPKNALRKVLFQVLSG